MNGYVQVFRAKVDPADVARLLEVRSAAIAEAQGASPALLRAELVRLDDETWLDLLTWSHPHGAEELMSCGAELPALHEMHALIGEVVAVEIGELAHAAPALPSQAAPSPAVSERPVPA